MAKRGALRQTCTFLGFMFVYLFKHVSSKGDCGGLIDVRPRTRGRLTSPNYGTSLGYRDNQYCVWLLKGPPGFRIKLYIEELDLGSKSQICVDYLEVRDGSSTGTRRYHGCRKTSMTTIVTASQWAWVMFRSDHSLRGRGFSLQYSSIPGGPPVLSGIKPPYHQCPSPNFRCTNYECVYKSHICDKKNDCGDNTDEIGCHKDSKPHREGVPTWATVVILLLGVAFVTAIMISVRHYKKARHNATRNRTTPGTTEHAHSDDGHGSQLRDHQLFEIGQNRPTGSDGIYNIPVYVAPDGRLFLARAGSEQALPRGLVNPPSYDTISADPVRASHTDASDADNITSANTTEIRGEPSLSRDTHSDQDYNVSPPTCAMTPLDPSGGEYAVSPCSSLELPVRYGTLPPITHPNAANTKKEIK